MGKMWAQRGQLVDEVDEQMNPIRPGGTNTMSTTPERRNLTVAAADLIDQAAAL